MLLFTHYITIRGLPQSAVSLSRCITCQDVCVQQSLAGLPFSDFTNKPRLHTKINPYSYNNNRAIASRRPVVPFPPFKICVPISYFPSRLLHTSNILFKKCFPPCGFWSPVAKSWRRVRMKTQKIYVTNKIIWVYLFDLKR